MFKKLRTYFSQIAPLSDKEFTLLSDYLTVECFPKKTFLLKKGEICTCHWFVKEGTLIKYKPGLNEEKHILQFAVENWWLSDLESAAFEKPSTLCIETLTDSEVIKINHKDYDILYKNIPAIHYVTRNVIIRAAIANRKRLENLLSLGAEERYKLFVQKYPEISNRVPLHMVASYLGIKAETLSRLRRKPMRESSIS